MRRTNWSKKFIIGGVLLLLGLVIPMIFQKTGLGWKVFIPMHMPVLLGGFLLPPVLAFLLGVLTPVLSYIITGFPILMPIGIIMIFELAVYGLLTSILYRKLGFPVLFTLVLSMIGGRLTSGGVVWFLTSIWGVDMLPAAAFVKGELRMAIPGIIIQLVAIPGLMYMINKWTTINIDW